MRQYLYHFASNWRIPAVKDVVAAVLLSSQQWTDWWPGLKEVRQLDDRLGVGARFICTWQAPLGYRLQVSIRLTEYQPNNYIAFDAGGDLQGQGKATLVSAGSGLTDLQIEWHVRSTKRWMNLFAPLLRPLFIRNHQALMRSGEQGLVAYIKHHNQGDNHGKA